MILKPVADITLFCNKAEPYLGVFGSKEWLSIYGKAIKLVGIYKDEHQLIGGFYYVEVKKYRFSFVKLPPYTPHCGLFFSSESKNKSSANGFTKEVMTEVANYIAALKSALTILAFPSSIVDLQPFIWQKYKVVPNYTYHIDLNQNIETIISNFDSKNRNLINKALKENVVVDKNLLDKKQLFSFFTKSLNATGANVYTTELENIFLKFASPSNSFSLAARLNNELLGVVFCVFDSKKCYYLLGGINKETGIQGINNLLIQKSIEYAKELGCLTFDFEGSMLKGVEKFFRGFGPELIPYYTINKAKLPLELILKFKKRELF